MMSYIRIKDIFQSPRKGKRFRIVLENDRDLDYIDFGSDLGNTYIDHGDKRIRENYIKRHSKLGEDWSDPYTAGFWSRWLLWGTYPDAYQNIKDIKKRFGLK